MLPEEKTLPEKLPERRIARTLTQKYDMHALRILQKLETELLHELGELYGCDEDDVNVELDLLAVYNADESDRKRRLEEMFAEVPGGAAPIVEKVLKRMEEIQESSHAGHSH